MKTEQQLWDIFDSCPKKRIETRKIYEKIFSGYSTLWGCFATYEEAQIEVKHRLEKNV